MAVDPSISPNGEEDLQDMSERVMEGIFKVTMVSTQQMEGMDEADFSGELEELAHRYGMEIAEIQIHFLFANAKPHTH